MRKTTPNRNQTDLSISVAIFLSWVRTVVHRARIKAFAQGNHHLLLLQEGDDIQWETFAKSENLESTAIYKVDLQTWIDSLPQWDQTLCRLILEGYKPSEIARLLQCNVRTIRRHLQKLSTLGLR